VARSLRSLASQAPLQRRGALAPGGSTTSSTGSRAVQQPKGRVERHRTQVHVALRRPEILTWMVFCDSGLPSSSQSTRAPRRCRPAFNAPAKRRVSGT
jgi:hypothetical protein